MAWTFRHHNRCKYPLLNDQVEISFSSFGRAVAFGAEGMEFNPSSGHCKLQNILVNLITFTPL